MLHKVLPGQVCSTEPDLIQSELVSSSHYYNEFKWDSDPETSGDFAAGTNVPEEDLDNENFVANERVSSAISLE
jgi:hypothetical protein